MKKLQNQTPRQIPNENPKIEKNFHKHRSTINQY